MSQVIGAIAVASEQRDPVSTESGAEVVDFLQNGLCIEQGGHRCEEAILMRLSVPDGGGRFIAAARQSGGFSGITLDAWPRCSDGENSSCHLRSSSHVLVQLQRPRWSVPARGIASCMIKGYLRLANGVSTPTRVGLTLAHGRRVKMMMHIDFRYDGRLGSTCSTDTFFQIGTWDGTSFLKYRPLAKFPFPTV